MDWAKGIGADGRPIDNPAKEPQPGGVLISPTSDGAANYPAPTFSPQSKLVYSHANTSFSLVYLDSSDEHPLGWGGGAEYHTGYSTSALIALDCATGRQVWKHSYPDMGFVNSSYPGLLTTAGGLLLTGDPAGDFIAFDAANGKALWHTRIGKVRNSPVTYVLDGRQYVVIATDDTLYSFAHNGL